jgi:hypothetical protein
MPTNPEVDAWFAELASELKPVMQQVRQAILDADSRLHERVQYGTVQFAYKHPLGSFVQVKDRKRVTLMFNAAGRLKGDFPHLEGKSVKYMYFTSDADVAVRKAELQAVARAWIAYEDSATRSRNPMG